MQWWKKRLLKRLQTENGELMTGEDLVDAVALLRQESWEAGRNEGYEEGYQTAEEEQCRAFSASLALALHDVMGWDKRKIMAFQATCNEYTAQLNDALIESATRELLTEVRDESKKHSDQRTGSQEGDPEH